MGFRLLLVGMVASMGLDLPSPERLDTWCRSGRSWLCGSLDDWNTWTPTGEEMCQLDDAYDAGQCLVVIDDAEFTAVMEDVVGQFEAERIAAEKLHQSLARAKRAAIQHERASKATVHVTVKHAGPAVVVLEPIEVPDNLYEGIAFELNRFGEGIETPVIEPAPVADEAPVAVAQGQPEPAPATLETEIVEVDLEEPAAPATPRVHRLATALRLTGEALEAWAKLLEGPAVVSLRP